MPTYNFTPKDKDRSPLTLGLDTGGTNTDAVLFDPESRKILLSAKDHTTHEDLSIGVKGALKKLLESLPDKSKVLERVKSVNLSTTLATNSIAEGYSHKVGLVLVGFDSTQDIVQDLIQKLPACVPIFIKGGHDYYGRQTHPLEEDKLRQEVRKAKSSVAAWAVSSFFSIKNPIHELRVAEIIGEECEGEDDSPSPSSPSSSPQDPKKPVTLGRNLTGELGAANRAATAALNAGLVLIIRKLLDAVKQSMVELGLSVPLMVVKGDGGMVSELWARERPIETVVSGPAAGLEGAKILAKGFLDPSEKNLWILDVGGTTSDLAYLENGRPKTNVNGAVVGQWTTMVEAVETTTRGLGGDSLVSFGEEGEILIGPRRVLPLCRLAARYPQIMNQLTQGPGHKLVEGIICRFFIPNLPPDKGLNHYEEGIIELLQSVNPLPFFQYHEECLYRGHVFPGLKFLSHPSILVSAFTPTDALAILGLYKEGVPEASLKAAYLLGSLKGLSPEEFARAVLNKMGELLSSMLTQRALKEDGIKTSPKDFEKNGIIGRAILKKYGSVSFDFSLNHPVILLGAPAGVLVPWLQKYLKARILSPPRYEVASATGAAASTVSLIRRVDIVSMPNLKSFRAFLPDRLMDDFNLNSLVARASQVMARHMTELAILAGAGENPPITMTRDDRSFLNGDGILLPLGSVLEFTLGYGPGDSILKLPPSPDKKPGQEGGA
jgi:N-methylhydantoinase A/oxoprolinase/acetone carboxylase beta subunit